MNHNLTVQTSTDTALLDLGAWLGRHQAFAMIATKCSAADAECLRQIRSQKLYKRLGLTWKEFCERHAGVDQKTANQIIGRLEEFGESYFRLSAILPLTPTTYRAIAPAVSEGSLEFEGERIPIEPANTERLSAAVRALREQSRPTSCESESKICEIYARLDRCLVELDAALLDDLTAPDQLTARSAIQRIKQWPRQKKCGR